ncbi:MAG: hypothetical protein MZV70_01750 [Desulfobacterales bacterium]|nr:hypothetical protein [Desulfobacterales bacterium]
MRRNISLPEMKELWELESKYKKFWNSRVMSLRLAEPTTNWAIFRVKTYKKLKLKANFDAERIDEIEKEVKHDVIAFVTSVNEFVGESSKDLFTWA